MMRKLLFTLLFTGFIHGFSSGQQLLELSECIEIALQNNLQIRQAENAREISEVNFLQSKFNFLPNLNAFGSVNIGIGTQVDNFTQQIAQSPVTSAPGFSTNITLFNGMTNWNTLKAREYDLAAAEHSVDAMKNAIRLNVVLAFFQVMFDTENLKITDNRLELLGQQLEKLEKQFGAGLITQDALLNLKAQLSTETVNQINLQNQRNKDLLSLIQYLELDPSDNYDIFLPPDLEVLMEAEETSIQQIFNQALANLPEIREKKMRILSAKYAVKNAKAAFYPTLSASFGAGSFYSSNARELLGFDTQTFTPIYGETTPLFNQLGDNFGSQVTFSLNIPVFNRYQARSGFRISEIQYRNTLLDLEIQENTIYKQVQQASLDVRASRAKYNATMVQLESLTASHEYALNRYERGLMDFYTYVEVLNNKTNAETELISSKYDFMLKKSILDIYQGKPIEF